MLSSPRGWVLEWTEDRFLFIDRSFLIDIRLAATVWEFDTKKVKTIVKGPKNQFWCLRKRGGTTNLLPFVLPSDPFDSN